MRAREREREGKRKRERARERGRDADTDRGCSQRDVERENLRPLGGTCDGRDVSWLLEFYVLATSKVMAV